MVRSLALLLLAIPAGAASGPAGIVLPYSQNPSTPTVNASLGTSVGKTKVMIVGNLNTTSAAAQQLISSYTVTKGKTFYLEYYTSQVRLGSISGLASILGEVQLESPIGTDLIKDTNMHPTNSTLFTNSYHFSEPMPFPSGSVIQITCDPAVTTPLFWFANFGGYEK